MSSSDESEQATVTIATACPVCGLAHERISVPRGQISTCVRCGSVLDKHVKNSLHRTAAFSLAALILYIPANYFPILKIDMYGATSVNTVWDGVKTLWQEGDWTVSTIVFLASIAIPLAKLTGLFTLVITAWLRLPRGKMPRTWLYRFIDLIGPWAMLDVFVLAVLVSLVKLHRLATVLPGEGVLAFGGVVIFTLLASQSYDPQLIWEKETDEQ